MFFQRKKVPSPARKLLATDRRVFFGFTCHAPAQGDQIAADASLCQLQVEEPTHFAHVGYTNFSTFHFAVVKMRCVSVSAHGCMLLRADRKDASGAEVAGGEVHTDMHFIRGFLDFTLQWRVSIFLMSENQVHWPNCPFEEHELVPVLPFPDVQPFLVWRGSEKEQESRNRAASGKQPVSRKSRKRDEPDGLEGAQLLVKSQPGQPSKRQRTQNSIQKDDGDNVLDIEDVGAADNQDPELDMLRELEAAYGFDIDNEEEAEHYDSEEEAEALALAQLAPDLVEAAGSEGEGEHALSPNDEESSDDSSDSSSISSHTDKGFPGQNATPAKLVSAAPAAPPIAVSERSAGDHKEPEGDQNLKERQARQPTTRNTGISEVFKVGSHGELRYHPVMKVLTAVCNEPDHDDCRRRRTVVASEGTRTKTQKGQGRPAGHLVAWLRSQCSHVSQYSHCHDFKCTRADRIAAREYLYSLPEGKRFADAVERPKRADEEDEPESLS